MTVAVAPEISRPSVLVSRETPRAYCSARHRGAPDGQSLVFEVVGITVRGAPAIRCDQVNADGSGRRPLLEDGRCPALSRTDAPSPTSRAWRSATPSGRDRSRAASSARSSRTRTWRRSRTRASRRWRRHRLRRHQPLGVRPTVGQPRPAASRPDIYRSWPASLAPVAHGLPTDPSMVGPDGGATQVRPAFPATIWRSPGRRTGRGWLRAAPTAC